MDYKLLLDVSVIAGELMLACGAETHRVEDTMQRMLSLSHLKTAEVFVTMTGFVATLDDPSVYSMTVVRRICSSGTDLGTIHQVNDISRRLCDEQISLETALHELKAIKRLPPRSPACLLAYPLITACFTVTYGGSLSEAGIAALVGAVMALTAFLCRRFHMQSFMTNVLTAASISVFSGIFSRMFGMSGPTDRVIVGSIMPLVPGVAITNAIFDTLHGDYLSGTARALEAFVIAAAVAIGVGLGVALGF